VPLVRQEPPEAASAAVLGRDPPRPLPVVSAEERTRPPGSEWLFAKLYCPPSLEDDLITKRVRGFCEAAEDAGWADAWFFVRYADPERHLRLRIHGPPERLAGALPGACAWAGALIAEGLCLRFCLDTYDREVERYGGTPGMAAAEALFAADSRAVAAVLDLVGRGVVSTDKTMIAVLMIDDLLAAAGLSEEGRLRWCRAHVANRRESSARYRRHQGPLRALVGDGRPPAEAAGGEDLARVLSARRAALAPVGLRLAALDREGRLSRSIEALCESYVHMCCNRLLGTERAEERMALGLLLRAREGLAATAASRRSGSA
jgi:thiopeptide-type bacteriocin biosynthesis protein